MKQSNNWKHWLAIIDSRICNECKRKQGKIYKISENVMPAPPLHLHCRCKIERLKSLFAGEATNKGIDGADWHLKYNGKLPEYYVTRDDAEKFGWKSSGRKLSDVLPGKMLNGGIYHNDDKRLPESSGRIWYEADIDYDSGNRNSRRILYSNDGLIFVSYNHYETFVEIR